MAVTTMCYYRSDGSFSSSKSIAPTTPGGDVTLDTSETGSATCPEQHKSCFSFPGFVCLKEGETGKGCSYLPGSTHANNSLQDLLTLAALISGTLSRKLLTIAGR